MKPSTLEYWKPRNIWDRLTDAVAQILLLRRQDAPSYRARMAHGVWLILMAVMLIAGVLLLASSPTTRPTTTGAMGGLALTATLGMFLMERLTSLLYDYPLRTEKMEESFLMRHPILALVFTAGLHLVAALSTDALLLLRSPAAMGWQKLVGMLLLGLAALPFWTLLLHIQQTFQKARKLRRARKERRKNKQPHDMNDEKPQGLRQRFRYWRKQGRQLKEFLQQLRQDNS